MRTTLMCCASDVRVEYVSDARLSQPTGTPAAGRLAQAGERIPFSCEKTPSFERGPPHLHNRKTQV